MIFSSVTFIFLFLPVTLSVYYLIPDRYLRLRNAFLLAASLFFYWFGEPRFVFLMVGALALNWGLALWMDRNTGAARRAIFIAIVAGDLSLLFAYKYLGFALENLDRLPGVSISIPDIALPVGISFFTFQALSYVIDVYRRPGSAEKSPVNVALYISMFPQLIAGPIVRFRDVAEQIRARRRDPDLFAWGVCRFIQGLGKKVIIANTAASAADAVFGVSASGTYMGGQIELTTGLAWVGAVAFAIQIYFDFSGYSDMAIGLGAMLGFRFRENFNYPYASDSLTQYWRRWNISLGTWFRDYVYIPMGGSRVTTGRHMFNLLVVWLLTGLWHGASWTFLAWGLYWFALVAVEKLFFEKKTTVDRGPGGGAGGLARRSGTSDGRIRESHIGDDVSHNKLAKWFARHCYIILVMLVGSVIFRSGTLAEAGRYLCSMAGLSGLTGSAGGGAGGALAAGGAMVTGDQLALFLLREYWYVMLVGAVLSFPVVPAAGAWLKEKLGDGWYQVIFGVTMVLLLVISLSFVIKGGYSPFIYFKF